MKSECVFWAQTLSNLEELFIFQLFALFCIAPMVFNWLLGKNKLFCAFFCYPISGYFMLNYGNSSPFTPGILFSPMAFLQGLKLCILLLQSSQLYQEIDVLVLELKIQDPKVWVSWLGRKPLLGVGGPWVTAGVVSSHLWKRKLWCVRANDLFKGSKMSRVAVVQWRLSDTHSSGLFLPHSLAIISPVASGYFLWL